jgi:ribosome recycling factor
MDIIIVLQRYYLRPNGIKRSVIQVAEVSRMDNKVLLANVFDTDETFNKIKRTDVPSP